MRMVSGAVLIFAAAIVFTAFFVVRAVALSGSSLIGPQFNHAEFQSTMMLAAVPLALGGLGLIISGFFERGSATRSM